jgi:hypothetical protein
MTSFGHFSHARQQVGKMSMAFFCLISGQRMQKGKWKLEQILASNEVKSIYVFIIFCSNWKMVIIVHIFLSSWESGTLKIPIKLRILNMNE